MYGFAKVAGNAFSHCRGSKTSFKIESPNVKNIERSVEIEMMQNVMLQRGETRRNEPSWPRKFCHVYIHCHARNANHLSDFGRELKELTDGFIYTSQSVRFVRDIFPRIFEHAPNERPTSRLQFFEFRAISWRSNDSRSWFKFAQFRNFYRMMELLWNCRCNFDGHF